MPDRKEIRVFISSPGDCTPEREAVARVLNELNRTSAESAGLYFHPLRWEEFVPGLGENPQEVIDKQLGDYHVLIGIMWMRFGTPIPGGADSGTEHEVNQAIKSWKRIGRPRVMFYFKDEPVPPSKIDPAQLQKVIDFRARLGKVGIIGAFQDTAEFEREVRIHLHKLIQLLKPRAPGMVKQANRIIEPSEESEEILRYLSRLKSQHESLALAGFETRIRVPIKLEDLYIPLQAQPDLRTTGKAEFADAEDAAKVLALCEQISEIPLIDAFKVDNGLGDRRGVVILGDPGSGKTTHLKRLILWIHEKKGESLGLPEDVVPLFLPLRELKEGTTRLDTFVADQLFSDDLLVEKGFGKKLLRRGRLLFLLDGLDEIPDSAARARVSAWINQAMTDYPTCYFVVTSRYAGYTSTARLSEKFLELHLQPLKEDQADAFVKNWYRIVEASVLIDQERAKKAADEQAQSLIDRLKQKDFRARRVFEMTRNPLLLTAICLVHRDRGRLPQRRGELYEECIHVLLERWREAKKLDTTFGAKEALQVLQPLAYWLHHEEGRTRADVDQMEPILDHVLTRLKDKKLGARDFLKTIRDESGLLTGWSDKSYGFMHLGFQEYLT
ncbi:MAG: NACHT domain-containing protein, partial [Planctomycetes bacterium]|nr:NACHT domain-containing protein [Planctomycetota bacterium]